MKQLFGMICAKLVGGPARHLHETVESGDAPCTRTRVTRTKGGWFLFFILCFSMCTGFVKTAVNPQTGEVEVVEYTWMRACDSGTSPENVTQEPGQGELPDGDPPKPPEDPPPPEEE